MPQLKKYKLVKPLSIVWKGVAINDETCTDEQAEKLMQRDGFKDHFEVIKPSKEEKPTV
jgi:hypothetical protein